MSPCFCLQISGLEYQHKLSPQMLPNLATNASTRLDIIKDVEIAISCRKGRSGTAAADVENLASVLQTCYRLVLYIYKKLNYMLYCFNNPCCSLSSPHTPATMALFSHNKQVGALEGTRPHKVPTAAPVHRLLATHVSLHSSFVLDELSDFERWLMMLQLTSHRTVKTKDQAHHFFLPSTLY
ncbi:hypothetical protein V6N13_059899 [Hibiscus sabdariffa]